MNHHHLPRHRAPATLAVLAALTLVLLLCLTGSGAAAEAPPFMVASALPYPALTRTFQNQTGWTGADGAYSIPLGPQRSLWLFGDTYIGSISGGKRINPAMVNNSAAWQSLANPAEPWHFFWAGDPAAPAPLLRPQEPGNWFWPGDGALVDGALYLFMKNLVSAPQNPPGFTFRWSTDTLVKISNPQAEPPNWKTEYRSLSPLAPELHLGTACLLEGDYLYVYGLRKAAPEASSPPSSPAPAEGQVILARIHRYYLADQDPGGWEFRADSGWVRRPQAAATIFEAGPTEMTVCRVKGLDGFFAVYTDQGMGPDIVIRHAPRPEGPWSLPLKVYHCPEADSGLLLYGAKAHPELATRYGQLIITYCRNTGSLEKDLSQPEVYFPQALDVRLQPASGPPHSPDLEITL